MSSPRYDVLRDHIANFLIFLSITLSFWFSLNTSYDHLSTDEMTVVAAVAALAAVVAVMATATAMATVTATATGTGMATATATAMRQ
jgi:hypothetical protein